MNPAPTNGPTQSGAVVLTKLRLKPTSKARNKRREREDHSAARAATKPKALFSSAESAEIAEKDKQKTESRECPPRSLRSLR